MPITAGNDTIVAAGLVTDIDGQSGDDLLALSYDVLVNGEQIYGIWLRIEAPGDWTTIQTIAPAGGESFYNFYTFTITSFERLDYTGSTLSGNAVYAGPGRDTLRGGSFADTLSGGDGGGLMIGGGGSDMIISLSAGQSDTIYGGDGSDTIKVSFGAAVDQIYGGPGDDSIGPVDWYDVVDGGAGNDTLSADLTELAPLNTRVDDLMANPRWTSIESFNLTLTAGNDILHVTSFSGFLNGGAGNDLLAVDRRGLSAVNQYFFQNWLTGFESLHFAGSAQNDIVQGTPGNDTIYGFDGNDVIESLSGADALFGGNGNDVFTGVTVADGVQGGAGFDIALLDLTGMTAGITLRQGQNLGNVYGVEQFGGVMTPFNDVFFAGALTVESNGGAGHDVLVVDWSLSGLTSVQIDLGPVSQSLILNPNTYGPWVAIGGWEVLYATGTAGDDYLSGGTGNDTIFGGNGNDVLRGSAGADILSGGAGNDTLIGDALDTLYGFAGDDQFQGYERGQTLYGGAGRDSLNFSFYDSATAVSLSTIDGANGWYSIDRLNGMLSEHDDTFRVTIADFDVDGLGGADLMIVDLSNAALFTRLNQTGSGLNSSILNVYVTGAVTPVTSRLSHFERLYVIATPGDDFFTGVTGNDTLLANSGNDSVSGGEGDDVLYGQDGLDFLNGGEGNDLIYGGGQSDVIWGGTERDSLAGGDGNDNLSGNDGDDALNGQAGDDFLNGGIGNDILGGDIGNDDLYGYDGHDSIYGGAGLDFLSGDAGNDFLSGGAESDLFIFAGNQVSGRDTIGDYALDDVLWISGGLTRVQVQLTTIGADILVSWASGEVLLQGVAGLTPDLRFDADFF